MNDNVGFKVRSDLAIEVVDQFFGEMKSKDNCVVKNEEMRHGLKVTCVDIMKECEERIGKKAGRYVSIDASKVDLDDSDTLEIVRGELSDELGKMIKYKKITAESSCLIVGLGNEHVTPDALGPLVVDDVIVTRHLFEFAPDEVDPKYREVSALAPGVMGLTGIETYDIIESVVKRVKPGFLIVVDALAARSVSRVNTVIQMTDTGVAPGSGVGGRTRAINEESLGIPVISLGVPTVVDAVSITSDTVDLLLKHIGKHMNEKDRAYSKIVVSGVGKQEYRDEDMPDMKVREEFMGRIGTLSDAEKRSFLEEVLAPSGFNMIVTPKNIDSEISNLAKLISNAVNVAVHNEVEFSV